MSDTPARQTLHPMLWVAAASVTALSLVGIAKFTGLLPGASTELPAAPEAVVSAPAGTPAPITVTPPPAKLAAAEPEVPTKAETATASAPHKEVVKPAPVKAHNKPQPAREPAASADTGVYPPPNTPAPPSVCRDCGVIESVEAIQQKGEGSGIGAVGGAILGGVLGHQVGEGSGKQIARIGGAVLGGFAGNEAERRVRTVSHYQVTVRMEDGTRRVITEQNAPVWRSGDPVRVRSGEIVAR
ncbi:MAG: glycine zipper 2TM domain-containing protein [Zoogloea sp.]|nr:glycine zipper 2TM domain-containing protein [Zoogloea sp.]